MNFPRKIKVLVVDDSALVRKMITESLKNDPEIEVVDTACDPYVARDKILAHKPDVLTLDIEMPRMDGISFLKILRQHHPLPVIVISSLTEAGSRAAMAALEAGAVDVLAKPGNANSIGDLGAQLARRVKGALGARCQAPLVPAAVRPPGAANPGSAIGGGVQFDPSQVILIGSSTGGIEALTAVLSQFPANVPPICIAQHIPPHFSKMVADRLNQLCAFEVRQAADGDEVRAGRALIAPGDYHMTLSGQPGSYHVRLNQRPAVHHCRPAVDVLFRSAANTVGRNAVAVILTGMGSDGAAGMQELKTAGARTLAQDEATCVVFGMPKVAIELGVVDRVVPLHEMAQAILRSLRPKAAPAMHAAA